MTIFCKLCRQQINSHLSAEEAIKDIMATMSSHLVVAHNKSAVELATEVALASSLIASYLLISRYVQIPASETELVGTFEETEDTLLQMMPWKVETRPAN